MSELPLPKWLLRIYYVFPIVLYVPDAIFNFYVYSDGSGIDLAHVTVATVPYIALWALLAGGVVGMAWLLSVLAPWHWSRGNRFQAVMCWIGVIIATAITIWNSLAYRSARFSPFPTDRLFPLGNGFSVTMLLVAVMPPFWGLFWAIVQPATNKRDAALEKESHQAKIERMQQATEIKRLRAEANAQIRAAQITGLAATARTARAQIAGKSPAPTTVTPESDSGLPALLPPATQTAANPLAAILARLPAQPQEEDD